jgi:hypothetical protein
MRKSILLPLLLTGCVALPPPLSDDALAGPPRDNTGGGLLGSLAGEAYKSAHGDWCVKASVQAGDVVPLPSGKSGTVTRITGPSSICQPAKSLGPRPIGAFIDVAKS